jgi:hypothetical protein
MLNSTYVQQCWRSLQDIVKLFKVWAIFKTEKKRFYSGVYIENSQKLSGFTDFYIHYSAL